MKVTHCYPVRHACPVNRLCTLESRVRMAHTQAIVKLAMRSVTVMLQDYLRRLCRSLLCVLLSCETCSELNISNSAVLAGLTCFCVAKSGNVWASGEHHTFTWDLVTNGAYGRAIYTMMITMGWVRRTKSRAQVAAESEDKQTCIFKGLQFSRSTGHQVRLIDPDPPIS